MKEHISPLSTKAPALDPAISAKPATIGDTTAQTGASLGPTMLGTNKYYHLVSLAVFRRLHRFSRVEHPFTTLLRLRSKAAKKYSNLLAPESKGLRIWNSIMEKDHPSAVTDHGMGTMDQAMEEAIARLPIRQREIFLMRFRDRVPYLEIAQRRGEPTDEVLKLLTSAYRQLRSELRT